MHHSAPWETGNFEKLYFVCWILLRKHIIIRLSGEMWDSKNLVIVCLHITKRCSVITLRPRQNGRHFPDDTFKYIFMNKNVRISINISLKFVPKGLINNIPALVQKMAWRRPGDKPLSEPMMVRLPTHICVTRPQWVIKDTVMETKFHYSVTSNYMISWHYMSDLTSKILSIIITLLIQPLTWSSMSLSERWQTDFSIKGLTIAFHYSMRLGEFTAITFFCILS